MAQAQFKRIVGFGASTIYGYGDSAGGFLERIKRWHQSQGDRNFVYNIGIFGDTLTGMAERFSKEVPQRKPNLIIVYAGYNEIRRVSSPDQEMLVALDQQMAKLRQILKSAKAICETLVINGFPFDQTKTTPFVNTDSYYLLADAELYCQQVIETAKVENCLSIDLFSAWSKLDYQRLLYQDGLHANDLGHQNIFELAQAKIVQ